MPQTVTITTQQEVTLTPAFTSPPDGPVTWGNSSPSRVQVVAQPDGTAVVKGLAPATGENCVTVTCNAVFGGVVAGDVTFFIVNAVPPGVAVEAGPPRPRTP